MTTASDLIDECSAQLHGWGSTADRVTPLAQDVGETDGTFQVSYAFGQSVGITPGVVEIGSELLYVVGVDQTNGICTLAPGFGRGYQSSTPATHLAGSPVISRPRFPRGWMLKQLNNVLGQVYPELFQVATYETHVKYPNNTYTIPVNLPMKVLDVQWQNPIGDWETVQSYKVDPYDQTLRLGSTPMVGRPLRVLYTREPGTFTLDSDDFQLTTGLPASCADVLTLGVVARLVPGLDISRAQTTSVEQSDRSRTVPPFAGVTAAKYLQLLFQERLKNEAQSLRSLYRTRLVRTW